MNRRKPIPKKALDDEKSLPKIDPLLEENMRWGEEMQSVLSPFWASRSVYPATAYGNSISAEQKRAA
jgi:hypothetical protein